MDANDLIGGSASGAVVNVIQDPANANDIPEAVNDDVIDNGGGEEEESDDEHYGTPTSSQRSQPPPVLLDENILDQEALANGEVVVNPDNIGDDGEIEGAEGLNVADMIADTGDYKITSTTRGQPKISHEGYW